MAEQLTRYTEDLVIVGLAVNLPPPDGFGQFVMGRGRALHNPIVALSESGRSG